MSLAYYIVFAFVPAQMVIQSVGSLPLGGFIQWVLKDITPHETVSEMTQYGPAYLIFTAFSGAAGPVILYLARGVRRTKTELVTTTKTVALLQGFCYVSWGILYFSSLQRSLMDILFWGPFLQVVLPATFLGLMCLVDVSQKEDQPATKKQSLTTMGRPPPIL